MQDNNQNQEQRLTPSTINSMLRVLNDGLRNDPSLANDLFQFLTKRNLSIPILSKEELSNLIPVSFTYKNSSEQVHKLKGAFEDVNSENLL